MGDGINDASALHAADAGISVDTAADVVKEAADFVLLEKDLLVLAKGVRKEEGRLQIHLSTSSWPPVQILEICSVWPEYHYFYRFFHFTKADFAYELVNRYARDDNIY